MSRRASGIVLLVLSFPLLMLGITAWKDATREADVRAWQLEQSVSAPEPEVRANLVRYAEDTLERQKESERNRNWTLAVAVLGAVAGVALVLSTRRKATTDLLQAAVTDLPQTAVATNPAPPSSPFRPCRACQWQISVEATACPRCGCPHVPEVVAAPAPLQTPLPVNKLQRAFYIALIVFGLGSAVVIYTVMFDTLSETELVRISPYWLFPSVFGYYGLVAQRMEARLQTTHLDNVSEQLLNVIKELGGFLGQAFAFLIHAPFLIVKSRRPWVVAFVGSLIWAIALVIFFELIFPQL